MVIHDRVCSGQQLGKQAEPLLQQTRESKNKPCVESTPRDGSGKAQGATRQNHHSNTEIKTKRGFGCSLEVGYLLSLCEGLGRLQKSQITQ